MKRANHSAIYVFIAAALMFSGCTSTKSLRKEDKLAADANAEERRAFALKLFKEGSELLYTENQEALRKFRSALEADPTFVPAYYNAAQAEEALGNKPEAAKLYDLCLQQNKKEESCLSNLLILKHDLGETESALALADTYVTEFAEEPFAYVAAAKLAFAQGDWARAEKNAREAIERDADHVEALYIMARIFFQRKLYPATKWVAKNALEIAPSHGPLHLLLGHTYAHLGLLHEALDEYTQAAKFYPSEEALESYGLMLMRRGRVADSLPVLKRLSELRPSNYRHHLHLGNAYMANKQFNEAKDAYNKALELEPADKDILFNLGLLYFDFKPKEIPELERVKTAHAYFKSYLEQPGLSKERVAEVQAYLKTLGQKIEMEESAAQAVPEEPEAPEEPGEPMKEPEEPTAPSEALPEKAPEELAPEPAESEIEEPALPAPTLEPAPEEKAKKDKKEKKKKEEKVKEPEVFDEEEEDIFEELE